MSTEISLVDVISFSQWFHKYVGKLFYVQAGSYLFFYKNVRFLEIKIGVILKNKRGKRCKKL